MSQTATRTLVAWCPDWPLVAAGIPPGVPAAAFHANRVVACTAAARAEGVTRGLRRREAQSRCPELRIEAHDPTRDARAFEPVVAAIETFCPQVEITRPGACALPTRGPSRYFGGDDLLADRVREEVDRVLSQVLDGFGGDGFGGDGFGGEVACRVGVADGPFAAGLAARRGLVVPLGGSQEFLAPLPVFLLDEPELTDLLSRLGLRTLGAFAELTVDDVVGRFGPVGAVAHRRARGLDDRDLDCRTPPPDLTTEITLDPPADRVDIAAFAGKSMADDLCATLSETGVVCTCIRIEAETEHGEHLARVWRHHRAFTPVSVAERVRWQLEGWLADASRCGCVPTDSPCPGGDACPNPAGGTTGALTLLRLVPEEVQPDLGRQSGFWGGATEADDRAARGLARVQGLLGPEAVVTAVLGGGRGPADRVRLVPWGEPRETTRPATPGRPRRAKPSARTAKPGSRVRTSGRSPSPTEIPAWPGRLPSPSPILVSSAATAAVPAEVVDASGEAVGVTGRSMITSAPARLSRHGGPWEEISAWAGPWTADERWWDAAAHRRCARIQVVLTSGEAHLLVLESGRWWVEGSYD